MIALKHFVDRLCSNLESGRCFVQQSDGGWKEVSCESRPWSGSQQMTPWPHWSSRRPRRSPRGARAQMLPVSTVSGASVERAEDSGVPP